MFFTIYLLCFQLLYAHSSKDLECVGDTNEMAQKNLTRNLTDPDMTKNNSSTNTTGLKMKCKKMITQDGSNTLVSILQGKYICKGKICLMKYFKKELQNPHSTEINIPKKEINIQNSFQKQNLHYFLDNGVGNINRGFSLKQEQSHNKGILIQNKYLNEKLEINHGFPKADQNDNIGKLASNDKISTDRPVIGKNHSESGNSLIKKPQKPLDFFNKIRRKRSIPFSNFKKNRFYENNSGKTQSEFAREQENFPNNFNTDSQFREMSKTKKKIKENEELKKVVDMDWWEYFPNRKSFVSKDKELFELTSKMSKEKDMPDDSEELEDSIESGEYQDEPYNKQRKFPAQKPSKWNEPNRPDQYDYLENQKTDSLVANQQSESKEKTQSSNVKEDVIQEFPKARQNQLKDKQKVPESLVRKQDIPKEYPKDILRRRVNGQKITSDKTNDARKPNIKFDKTTGPAYNQRKQSISDKQKIDQSNDISYRNIKDYLETDTGDYPETDYDEYYQESSLTDYQDIQIGSDEQDYDVGKFGLPDKKQNIFIDRPTTKSRQYIDYYKENGPDDYQDFAIGSEQDFEEGNSDLPDKEQKKYKQFTKNRPYIDYKENYPDDYQDFTVVSDEIGLSVFPDNEQKKYKRNVKSKPQTAYYKENIPDNYQGIPEISKQDYEVGKSYLPDKEQKIFTDEVTDINNLNYNSYKKNRPDDYNYFPAGGKQDYEVRKSRLPNKKRKIFFDKPTTAKSVQHIDYYKENIGLPDKEVKKYKPITKNKTYSNSYMEYIPDNYQYIPVRGEQDYEVSRYDLVNNKQKNYKPNVKSRPFTAYYKENIPDKYKHFFVGIEQDNKVGKSGLPDKKHKIFTDRPTAKIRPHIDYYTESGTEVYQDFPISGEQDYEVGEYGLPDKKQKIFIDDITDIIDPNYNYNKKNGLGNYVEGEQDFKVGKSGLPGKKQKIFIDKPTAKSRPYTTYEENILDNYPVGGEQDYEGEKSGLTDKKYKINKPTGKTRPYIDYYTENGAADYQDFPILDEQETDIINPNFNYYKTNGYGTSGSNDYNNNQIDGEEDVEIDISNLIDEDEKKLPIDKETDVIVPNYNYYKANGTLYAPVKLQNRKNHKQKKLKKHPMYTDLQENDVTLEQENYNNADYIGDSNSGKIPSYQTNKFVDFVPESLSNVKKSSDVSPNSYKRMVPNRLKNALKRKNKQEKKYIKVSDKKMIDNSRNRKYSQPQSGVQINNYQNVQESSPIIDKGSNPFGYQPNKKVGVPRRMQNKYMQDGFSLPGVGQKLTYDKTANANNRKNKYFEEINPFGYHIDRTVDDVPDGMQKNEYQQNGFRLPRFNQKITSDKDTDMRDNNFKFYEKNGPIYVQPLQLSNYNNKKDVTSDSDYRKFFGEDSYHGTP